MGNIQVGGGGLCRSGDRLLQQRLFFVMMSEAKKERCFFYFGLTDVSMGSFSQRGCKHERPTYISMSTKADR